jgi:hypothetical protein
MQISNSRPQSNSRNGQEKQLPSIFQQLETAPLRYSQLMHCSYSPGSFTSIPPLSIETYGESTLDSKLNPNCTIIDCSLPNLTQVNKFTDRSEINKCPDCKLNFKNSKGMRQHMGKVHCKDLKKVPCTICQKSFKNKYAMKFHIKQVHEKSTRVTCSKCGTTIYNKYMLKKHIQKHGAQSTADE